MGQRDLDWIGAAVRWPVCSMHIIPASGLQPGAGAKTWGQETRNLSSVPSTGCLQALHKSCCSFSTAVLDSLPHAQFSRGPDLSVCVWGGCVPQMLLRRATSILTPPHTCFLLLLCIMSLIPASSLMCSLINAPPSW